MPTPSPINAPKVGAAVEMSSAPASSATLLIPTATPTSARTIGTSAATRVPKTTTRMTSATSTPNPSLPDDFSPLSIAASPPSSAVSPSARAGSRASTIAAAAGRPSSVDGTSRVISAYATRPSSDTRFVAKGSDTVETCSTAATRESADSTPARKLVNCAPSGAANTATAVPPAACGKRSSSSFVA